MYTVCVGDGLSCRIGHTAITYVVGAFMAILLWLDDNLLTLLMGEENV